MAPIDDETLDRLLTGHLSAQLDGQVGRAEPAFRRGLWAAAAASQDIAPLRVRRDEPFVNEPLADEPHELTEAPGPLTPHRHDGSREVAAPFAPDPTTIARPASQPLVLRPQGSRAARIARWAAAVSGTAVAASLATMLLLPRGGTINAVPPNGGAVVVSPPSSTGVPSVRYVQDRAIDEGAVVPEGSNQPFRKVRREQVEHIRFFDEQTGAWVEMTVPRENIEFYKMDTY